MGNTDAARSGERRRGRERGICHTYLARELYLASQQHGRIERQQLGRCVGLDQIIQLSVRGGAQLHGFAPAQVGL